MSDVPMGCCLEKMVLKAKLKSTNMIKTYAELVVV